MRFRTVSLIVLLAGSAVTCLAADPIGHWPFNGDLSDAVGAADGVFNGGTATFSKGKAGLAIEFDGVDDYVDVMVGNIDAYTISAWVKPTRLGAASFVARTSASGTTTHWSHQVRMTAGDLFEHYLYDGSARSVIGTTVVKPDTWYHVAITAINNGDMRLYVNGQEEGIAVTIGALWSGGDRYAIGSDSGNAMGWFEGLIDDVHIYDQVLPQEEIMPSLTVAANPAPEDLMTDVLRDAVLNWAPGEFAVTHDVYFGTTFAQVADATTPVSQSQDANTFDPGVLAFDQTYYWRVDEVNGAPDRTVFKGDVWSFTVEPVAIPVKTVTASASGANANMGPEKTIDGSGLNAMDQHSSQPLDMWLAAGANPWIQYDFDKPYKLHTLLVWNSNQAIEAFMGFGAKEVTVEYTADGATWAALEGPTLLNQATGLPTYEANTAVALSGIMAQSVKLTVNSGHGSFGQSGLAEVRFMAIPVTPREPQPVQGATTATATVELGWRSGREAVSHEVYLGTDAGNLTRLDTTTEASSVTDPLDYETTYFWSVTEVNEAADPTTHAGDLWSFSTPQYATVDDFESYSGDDGAEVFMTWFDGYGGDASLGGSTTGHIDGPFVETGVIYGGQQSLPLYYDNNGGFIDIDGKSGSPTFSEVVREFDSPQDWTASGITSLSLQIFGAADNGVQLYLKINSTKVDGAPDISQPGWQAWIVDLSSLGAPLNSVTQLTIGVEGGTEGVLYIDDIRLYPRAAEYVTPVEPDSAKLLAYYPLDGNANDNSGNGVNGEEIGAPTYVAGAQGQAIQLNGFDDYVDVVLNIPEDSGAVSFWFNTLDPDCGLYAAIDGILGAGGHDRHVFLNGGNVGTRIHDGGTMTTVGLNVADGQWHHLVHTYGADVGGQKLYIDGLLQVSGPKAQSDFDWQKRIHIGWSADGANDLTEGMIDEVRIYNSSLSMAEATWLAGITDPVVMPF